MTKIDVVSIDSGIPMPPTRNSYPLAQLEIGDSFSFSVSVRASVQSAASLLKRTTKKEFRIRKMDAETCRVWRVK